MNRPTQVVKDRFDTWLCVDAARVLKLSDIREQLEVAYLAGWIAAHFIERWDVCKSCGCTAEIECTGGCDWTATENLCSRCADCVSHGGARES